MKQYKIRIKGNAYDVVVGTVDENGKATVTVNGKEHDVEIIRDEIPVKSAVKAAGTVPVPVAVKPAPVASQVSVQASGTSVTTPLPGVIIGIRVNIGDKVAAGQTVAVLEAMKMENSIESEVAGTVTAIHVQRGDSVLEGAKIVTIE